MRHGKSRWDEGVGDHDRDLTTRGEANAEAMGAWIATNGFTSDVVVASRAKRARRTAELACKGMGLDGPFHVEQDLYGAGVSDYARIAASHEGTVMLVAHNPTMEAAALQWTGGPETLGKVMPTAAVAVIDTEARKLVAHQRPR